MPSFRRVIDIRTQGTPLDGQARVALEDDYHHFRVGLVYKDNKISDTFGEGLRTPYTTCGAAAAQLQSLIGMTIQRDRDAIGAFTNPKLQCTHMFDEAGLAVNAAAQGIKCRRYEIEVPRHVDGATHSRIWRDGELIMQWHINGDTITAPEQFVDMPLRHGMGAWVQENLSESMQEAAFILRRCSVISIGRLYNLDELTHARNSNYCYAQQEERAQQSLRVKGSTEDFSDRLGELTKADQSWLNELA